jgi:hypothetical protein
MDDIHYSLSPLDGVSNFPTSIENALESFPGEQRPSAVGLDAQSFGHWRWAVVYPRKLDDR